MTASSFSPAQRPAIAGAPYLPAIGRALKLRYALVGVALATSSTFGNGLVVVNLQAVAGGYGVDLTTAAWLLAVYVGVGASANIFMIKGRQEFALEPLLFGSLALYAAVATLEIVAPSFELALVSRALNGMATSTIVATGVYYLMLAFDGPAKALSVPLSIAFAQLGTPLARLVPVEFLASGGNSVLHLMLLTVVLSQFLLVWTVRLPPTYTVKAFEPLDGLTALLLVPAFVMFGAVFALGRALWWTDAPWLGWLAAAAVGLTTVALILESARMRPIVDLAWLGRRDILVFLIVATVERLALAEQSSGSVQLLAAAGLGNDQLHQLYAWVIGGMLAGIIAMVLTLRLQTIPIQIMVALGAILAGALLDTASNALTRPDQLIVSQTLIGFGTTLFVGPALLFFVGRFLFRGPEAYVPTILLFGAIQNLGSVAGAALVESVQYAGQTQALQLFLAQLRVTRDDLSASLPAISSTVASAYEQAFVIGHLDAFAVVAALAGSALLLVATVLILSLVGAPGTPHRRDA